VFHRLASLAFSACLRGAEQLSLVLVGLRRHCFPCCNGTRFERTILSRRGIGLLCLSLLAAATTSSSAPPPTGTLASRLGCFLSRLSRLSRLDRNGWRFAGFQQIVWLLEIEPLVEEIRRLFRRFGRRSATPRLFDD
jgi:hypothetical protein